MAIYSICSLNIETDCLLGKTYHPFLLPVDMRPERIDMTVRQAERPHYTENLRCAAELEDISVWEKTDRNGKVILWVYTVKNGFGSFSADPEYRKVEYCFSDVLSSLGKNWVGSLFAQFLHIIIRCKLILNGSIILHSACVELDGMAYAFTGPSGIGKSTRASKWCELFAAEWISGDRPVIDVGDVLAYGAPWDGKEAIYRNTCCPLAAILKVSRSESAQIIDMTDKEKLQLLFEQVFFPMWDVKLAAKAVVLIKRLIEKIPVYELRCDITDESVIKAKSILNEKWRAAEEGPNEDQEKF